MAARPTYSFGEPDWDTVTRWLHLDEVDDGPVWMLNLMRYRPVAVYADGRQTTITGREADDLYSPVGPLEAIGATVPLLADVTVQSGAEPPWDRVAIALYPTRRSFFEMQRRDDFKAQYVHKEAGMETTIVMGCVPATLSTPPPDAIGDLVLRVRRFVEGERPGPEPAGVSPVVRFDVDGVVLGDGRTWDEARFDRVAPGALDALSQVDGVAEQFVLVIDPLIEDLAGSVVARRGAGY